VMAFVGVGGGGGWSEILATHLDILGSITGSTRLSEK
jgi:hypothetical protein